MKTPRWLMIQVLLGAALAIGGSVFGPMLIRGIYERVLFPSIASRLVLSERHELEHYLRLGRTAVVALTLAWIGHGALLVLARKRGLAGRGLLLFGCYTLVFLLVTVLVGPRQDYLAYREIWEQIRVGGDPWWVAPERGYPLNAYGPLFCLLAVPAGWNILAPKLFFAWVYLLVVLDVAVIGSRTANDRSISSSNAHWWTSHQWHPEAVPLRTDRSRGEGGSVSYWAMWLGPVYLCNPSFWIQVAWYGHFDILVAVCCLMAVRLAERGKGGYSGAWLAAGGLLKFLPLVLVPFLAVAGSGRRIRLALVALVVTVLGLGLAWGVWGAGVIRPMEFAATRGSNLLSIFRFLRGSYSPLMLLGLGRDVDHLAAPALGVGLVGTLIVCVRYRADAGTSAVLAMLTTLLLYRVGFVQYQVVLALLLVEWGLGHVELLEGRMRLAASVAAYLVWISLFDMVDWGVGGIVGVGRSWAWLEEFLGLPTFLLGSWLWTEMVLSARGRKQARGV